jgi:hypothetical protein
MQFILNSDINLNSNFAYQRIYIYIYIQYKKMCRKTYASDGAAEATWPRSTVDLERRNRGSTISRPTRFGTMGTTSTELRKKEQGGTMSRPT